MLVKQDFYHIGKNRWKIIHLRIPKQLFRAGTVKYVIGLVILFGEFGWFFFFSDI